MNKPGTGPLVLTMAVDEFTAKTAKEFGVEPEQEQETVPCRYCGDDSAYGVCDDCEHKWAVVLDRDPVQHQ